MAGGGGGGGPLLPTDGKSCPVVDAVDVDDAPLVDVVEELRNDCINCCMIEVLLKLETLKTVSPLTGRRAVGGRETPNPSAPSKDCEKRSRFQRVTVLIQTILER